MLKLYCIDTKGKEEKALERQSNGEWIRERERARERERERERER